MPSYSQEVIEHIREANDIVSVVSQYVPLQKKGGYHFGLCPFHHEKSPSFSVTEDKQIFYCFGCGAGGNVISFIMRIENYGFQDAIKFLADRIHYTIPESGAYIENKQYAELKQAIYEIHIAAARFYYDSLSTKEGEKAVQYLDTRNISQASRRKFGLGYSPSNRSALFTYLLEQGFDITALLKSGLVMQKNNSSYYDRFYGRLMFPIFDLQSRIIGFGGRILVKGEPKYLNSPETPVFDKSKSMYAINFARKEKKDMAILVEGYMDVIALYQAGFRNAVAALGTGFNDEHIRSLKKICKTVTLLFDSDEAGEKAALRAIRVLRNSGLIVKVLQLEGAKDPDEYLTKFGKEMFAKSLSNALTETAFQIECAKRKYDLNSTEQKVNFTKDAASIIAALDNAIERDAYGKEVVKMVGLDEMAVKYEVERQVNSIELSPNAAAQNTRMRGRTIASSGKGATKAIDDARRNTLLAVVTSESCADVIIKHVEKEEFVVPVYVKLFEIIEQKRKEKLPLNPADLVNYFETVEEQQTVSNIFSAVQHYEDEKKALSDQIREIKIAYYDEKIVNTLDFLEMHMLADKRRNLSQFEIDWS